MKALPQDLWLHICPPSDDDTKEPAVPDTSMRKRTGEGRGGEGEGRGRGGGGGGVTSATDQRVWGRGGWDEVTVGV